MCLNLASRSTTDLVVLILTVVVAIVLILMIVAGTVGKMLHPEIDMGRISESINQTVSAIVGALIGFISGRALGRNEQINGERKETKT